MDHKQNTESLSQSAWWEITVCTTEINGKPFHSKIFFPRSRGNAFRFIAPLETIKMTIRFSKKWQYSLADEKETFSCSTGSAYHFPQICLFLGLFAVTSGGIFKKVDRTCFWGNIFRIPTT